MRLNATLIGAKAVREKFVSHMTVFLPNIVIAMKQAVILVEAEAKKLCPVGDTGLLRRSIKGIVEEITWKYVIGKIGTNVPYAIYVHEGHHFRNGKGFVLARPFLRQALENKKVEINTLLSVAVFKDFGVRT